MVLLGYRFDRHYVEAANVLLSAGQTAGRMIVGQHGRPRTNDVNVWAL